MTQQKADAFEMWYQRSVSHGIGSVKNGMTRDSNPQPTDEESGTLTN